MAVSLKTTLRIEADETASKDLGTSRLLHSWPPTISFPLTYASGTSASQQDLVWSDTSTATAAADTIDLTGSLTSQNDGSAVNFANISGFAVYNRSTTATENLTIGAGSNPWITWLNATGDAVVIGPGGFFVWSSPVDAAAVTATTGDILTIDPGADTITYDIIVWGQSS